MECVDGKLKLKGVELIFLIKMNKRLFGGLKE